MKTKLKNSILYQGTFDSFRLQKTIPYKNQLEHDYLYRLEFDSTILTYSRFDSFLHATDRSNPLTIFPSFFVMRTNGEREVVLLESAKNINCPKAQLVKSRIELFCQQKGLNFVVLTESDVQHGELVNNLRLLYPYVNTPFAASDVFTIRNLFKSRTSITIGELKRLLSEENLISTFLFHNALWADLSAEIVNDKTLVTSGILLDGFVQFVKEITVQNLAVNN
jgi:hypothetical protein